MVVVLRKVEDRFADVRTYHIIRILLSDLFISGGLVPRRFPI